MLSFEFNGVAGEMIVPARLTSGMVGTEVSIRLSSDWDNLTKTAVFVAGDICRATEFTGSILTIPEEVLRDPYRKLMVGVCGTNSDGSLVIPTILAPGPFIEIGADPTADPVAVDIPVWRDIQNQIGNLSMLDTEAKSSLVAAINELAGKTDSGAAGADGKDGQDGKDGVDGEDGKDGEDGTDGFSIFPVDFSIGTTSTSAINVKPTLITTSGRSVQVGDLLLTSNSCIARVISVGSSVSAQFVVNLAPVRGTDYWTEEDIVEIKAYVDEAILGGAW